MKQFDFLFQEIERNTQNYITYKNSDGVFIKKFYRELWTDLQNAVYNYRNLSTAEGLTVVIVGKPSYNWLIAALFCIYNNYTIIALPENLSESEMLESLKFSNISFDLVFADKTFEDYTVFSKKDIITLGDNIFTHNGSVFFDENITHTKALIDIVAFSSGTTATHALKSFHVYGERIYNHIYGYVKNFNLTTTDNWLVCHSFSHVVHLEYVLGGLLFGYNVTLAEPIDLVLRPQQFSPSAIVTVPTVYEQIFEQIKRKVRKDFSKVDFIGSALEVNYNSADVLDWRQRFERTCPECLNYLGENIKFMIIGAAPSRLNLKKVFHLMGYPMYEGYGMTEIGMISCNVPNKSKIGTVGRVFEGIQTLISEDNVLFVKPDFKCASRYLHEKYNSDTFFDNGWINTGDNASVDEEGYITINGRVKEIIISDGGKNIIPEKIEEKLNSIFGIEHSLVYGDSKPYIVALLFKNGTDNLNLSHVEQDILSINTFLPNHEKIRDFLVLENVISIENQMLTRSGKLRRKVIYEYYQSDILNMY